MSPRRPGPSLVATLLGASLTGCCSTAGPPPAPDAVRAAATPAAAPAPAPVAPASQVLPASAGAQRIDIDVEDADLAEVMDMIGRQVGRNILVDPNVHERVTVTLRDVHWREAVDVIARMTRCEVEVR